MKTITIAIFLSFLCSVGYGHEWESKHNHYSPTLIVREPSLQLQINQLKEQINNLKAEDDYIILQHQIDNLKAAIEGLRKLIESKHAPKDAVNRYECGCRP